MSKRKLFSKKDGTTFIEDMQDISDEAKAIFNGLPLKLKKWLYESTQIVEALQKLDEALEDGQPVDKVIDFILAQIKGEAQENIYEAIKVGLTKLIEFINNNEYGVAPEIIMQNMGFYKANFAGQILEEISGLNSLEADTVTQNAVYIYKS